MTFDATAYWRDRMRSPSLVTTGAGGLPESWQRWRYRAVSDAFRRAVLRKWRAGLSGRSVFDFGCGTGFFEDLAQSLGATQVGGIDVSSDAIRRLRAAHPERLYLEGNLAEDAEPLARPRPFDLVTAIDVMFHIVDDAALDRILDALCACVASGGLLLVTDDPTMPDSVHVKHRARGWWEHAFERRGLRPAGDLPVLRLSNPFRGSQRLPAALAGLVGAGQYAMDRLLLSAAPALATKRMFLAVRDEEQPRGSKTPPRS